MALLPLKVVQQGDPDAMPPALESGLKQNGENSKSKQTMSNEYKLSNESCSLLSTEQRV